VLELYARLSEQVRQEILGIAVQFARGFLIGLRFIANSDELPAMEQQWRHIAFVEAQYLADERAPTQRLDIGSAWHMARC